MEGSITKRIIFIARKMQLCIGERLSKFEITATEEPFFMAIQRKGGATQEDLTAFVGVDKAVTTRAIRSLENKGYLVRKKDERDRRQNRVYPTAAAFRIGDSLHNELLCLNDELVKGLSEEQLQVLSEALSVIENNLSAMRGTRKYDEFHCKK